MKRKYIQYNTIQYNTIFIFWFAVFLKETFCIFCKKSIIPQKWSLLAQDKQFFKLLETQKALFFHLRLTTSFPKFLTHFQPWLYDFWNFLMLNFLLSDFYHPKIFTASFSRLRHSSPQNIALTLLEYLFLQFSVLICSVWVQIYKRTYQ